MDTYNSIFSLYCKIFCIEYFNARTGTKPPGDCQYPPRRIVHHNERIIGLNVKCHT